MEHNGNRPETTYWCVDHGMPCVYGDPAHELCRVTQRAERPTAGASVSLGARGVRRHKRKPTRRILTKFAQLDFVLGGSEPGFFDREVVLLTGEPGCGKSTVVLVIAQALGQRGARVLVVTGEESVSDVAARAAKTGVTTPQTVRVVATQSWEVARAEADRFRPHFVIVDSVQRLATMRARGRAGSVAQVEAIGTAAVDLAKRSAYGPVVLLIGHIIKDGSAAGPMGLVHDVDAHLHFSLDAATQYRVITSHKNRGGPSGAMSVWRFDGPRLVEVLGWTAEIVRAAMASFGAVAFAAKPINGQPYVVPVEAAVSSPRDGGTALRRAVGFPVDRLRDIVDGLEEHAGLSLEDRDVRVSVPEFAERRINDTALDFAVAAAIVSSAKRLKLPPSCVMGAVGITGRVTPVSDLGDRVGVLRACDISVLVTSSWHASVEAACAGVEFVPVSDLDGLVKWVQTVGTFVPLSQAQVDAANERKEAREARKASAEARRSSKVKKGAEGGPDGSMD